jgi:exosortase/archaeosortase family protein
MRGPGELSNPESLLRPRIHRTQVSFVASILAGYLAPIFIPGMGFSILSTFTVVLILFTWLVLKWKPLGELRMHSGLLERILGVSVVVGDYTRNIVASSNLGIFDMLVIFVGLWVAFYGTKNARFFAAPTVYVLILLTGYEIEYHIPQVQSLEYFLANLMAEMMRRFGIQAQVDGNIVVLGDLSQNPLFLQVDGPCTGLQGILAFGMLSGLALTDLRIKTKMLVPLLLVGFVGAFLINFLRLALVFLTFEFAGVQLGQAMHAYAGYMLFLAWVLLFWSLAFRFLSSNKEQMIKL